MTAQAHGHSAEMERVYVWDLVVRMSHWTIMLTMILLVITGVYIGNPYLIKSQRQAPALNFLRELGELTLVVGGGD